jgi:hypothetical protein
MKRVIYLILIFLLNDSIQLYADPLPLLAGSALNPLNKTSVKMLSENLLISVSHSRIHVHAKFLFKNPAEKTSFLVGFPCEQAIPNIMGMNCKQPLEVKLKIKKFNPKVKRIKNYGMNWVWNMSFEKNEEVHLELDYSVSINNPRYRRSTLASAFLIYYRLKTGANWAGPIGQLKIRIEVPLETIIQIIPRNYKRYPGIIEWNLVDYEPDRDLFVVFSPSDSFSYARRISNRSDNDYIKSQIKFATSFKNRFKEHQKNLEFQHQILAKRFDIPSMVGMKEVIDNSYQLMLPDISNDLFIEVKDFYNGTIESCPTARNKSVFSFPIKYLDAIFEGVGIVNYVNDKTKWDILSKQMLIHRAFNENDLNEVCQMEDVIPYEDCNVIPKHKLKLLQEEIRHYICVDLKD